jgi:hypothetical protein
LELLIAAQPAVVGVLANIFLYSSTVFFSKICAGRMGYEKNCVLSLDTRGKVTENDVADNFCSEIQLYCLPKGSHRMFSFSIFSYVKMTSCKENDAQSDRVPVVLSETT